MSNVVAKQSVVDKAMLDPILSEPLISTVMIVALLVLVRARRLTFVETLEEISIRSVRLDCSLMQVHDCMVKVEEAALGRETKG